MATAELPNQTRMAAILIKRCCWRHAFAANSRCAESSSKLNDRSAEECTRPRSTSPAGQVLKAVLGIIIRQVTKGLVSGSVLQNGCWRLLHR